MWQHLHNDFFICFWGKWNFYARFSPGFDYWRVYSKLLNFGFSKKKFFVCLRWWNLLLFAIIRKFMNSTNSFPWEAVKNVFQLGYFTCKHYFLTLNFVISIVTFLFSVLNTLWLLYILWNIFHNHNTSKNVLFYLNFGL